MRPTLSLDLTVYIHPVSQVGKPNVGENCPSRVRADVSIELNVADTVRWEWEGEMRVDGREEAVTWECEGSDGWVVHCEMEREGSAL